MQVDEIGRVDAVQISRPPWTQIAQTFLAFSLVMIGNGLLLTLLGVQATRLKFGGITTGAVLGAYYIGFLGGARHAPAMIRRCGIGRAMMLLAVVMAGVTAAPAIAPVAAWWIALRLVQGYAISASYVAMEAYLNGAVSNERRGRLLGAYMVITMAAFGFGAFAVRFTGTDGRAPFLIAGAATLLGAVTLLRFDEPSPARADHRRLTTHPGPGRLTAEDVFRLTPVGAVAGVLVGIANAAISTVAVYSERAGLNDDQTSLVSAVGALGPILVLYPLGALSDRMPRRWVLAGAATVAGVLMMGSMWMRPAGAPMLIALFVIGGLTVSLYTLTSADTNDRVGADHVAEVGSFVILMYGSGAIVGNIVATLAIDISADGFFWVNAAAHAALVAVIALLGRGPSKQVATPPVLPLH